MKPDFKAPPFRSKKIRELPKHAHVPCTLRLEGCVAWQSGTVVLAHLRRFTPPIAADKPDDTWAVYACANCHDKLDRRQKGEVTSDDILYALNESQRIMHQANLIGGYDG